MKSDLYKNQTGDEVDFTLSVFTRPNFRDGTREMFMYIGKSIIDNVFEKKQIDLTTTEISIEYPETWCNIIELRLLVDRIFKYYPNLKKLHIKTHSVYIIQCVYGKHILIHDNNIQEKFSETTERQCDTPDTFVGLMYLNYEKRNY
jgi:hypothetical protein